MLSWRHARGSRSPTESIELPAPAAQVEERRKEKAMPVGATVVLLVAAGCVSAVTVFVASVHGSLRTMQSSLDQEASELRKLRTSQRDTGEELHRLRQEVLNASAAGARHDEALGRGEELARRSSDSLRDATVRLAELRVTMESFGPPIDVLSQKQEDSRSAQEVLEANVKEVQGALDDVRSTVSRERAWHDQIEAWRSQEQNFELETREALQELQGAQPARLGGELGVSLAAASEDQITPRSSAKRVATPAQSLVTPRPDAATRHTTEAAKVAQLAAPVKGPAMPGPTTVPSRDGLEAPAAPAQSLVTPQRDAATRHTTEAAKVAQLAAPVKGPAMPGPTTVPSRDGFEAPAAPAQSLVTPQRDAATRHTTEAAKVAQLAASGVPGPTTVLSRDGPEAPEATHAGLQISWYRECGCTGMEVEAVTLLEALVRSLGSQRVRTNGCKNTCTWPDSTRQVLEQIELRGDEGHLSFWLFADRPPGPVVFVVHTAFLGVCGLPEFARSPRLAEDDALVQAVGRGRPGLLRVSRSMLENDRLDAPDARRCNTHFDAVWVPSKFNVETFSRSGVDARLLRVLPEAVDPRRFNCSAGSPPARARSPPPLFGARRLDRFVAAGGGPDTFTFLSVFKWEERKNWRTLLKTFWRTFPHRSTQVVQENGQAVDVNVRLLIKTQSLQWSTGPDEDIARLTEELGVDAEEAEFRMLMTRKPLPASLLPGLYRAADAFVLPSHGEGWGLPLMEAMASGLPTIGTGWGGSTEFMHAGNSVLLGYELVDVPHGDSDEGQWPMWADPDPAALAQAMRDAVRRPASFQSLAEAACREVGEVYNPDAVVHRLVTELAQVAVAVVT